jgi:DNA-3-methyladenine glycosylase II
VRKAVQRAYGLPALPSSKEVDLLGEKWRPHRSLATSYLYASL